jgi:MFS transporter, UMF1 family
MSDAALGSDVRPREVWAWAMYDFANSGYTTVVITAVFNAYFVSVVAAKASWATFAWTLALSASYLLIILSAPLVGAYADAHACKKRLLLFTTSGCVLGTALLSLVGPGDLALACALIVWSNFCFGSGENIVAAFLPELAKSGALGKVSAWGWALGYIGGLLTLALCLGYVVWATSKGTPEAEAVPITMLITAVIFALASLPTFLFLKERARPTPKVEGGQGNAWSRVAETMSHARTFKDLMRFLLCIVLYQSGVQTVIALAAIYAQEAMNFTTRDTLLLVLVVNVTASIGAVLFGTFQDRLGHKFTLGLTLVGWCVMVLIAWGSATQAGFWVAANVAGVCLGASQSAGRAFVGYLSPEDRHGEFFGLWGLAVKLASILGPVTYGAVSWLSNNDHRLAMLVTGSFFVLGLLVLRSIDLERGRAAAMTG